MQGPHIYAFTEKDMITAFIKKLSLWLMSLKNNNFNMFPTFKKPLADEVEENKVLNNHYTSL